MGVVDLQEGFLAVGRRISRPGEDANVIIKTKGGFLLREDLSAGAYQETNIVNSGAGRRITKDGIAHAPGWTTAYFRPDHIPALACALDLTRPNMGVSYLGIEPLGQSYGHHIVFSAAPSGKSEDLEKAEDLISRFHVYLDSQSFVVLKTARFVFSPDAIENRSLWETTYGDYRNAGGVLMPFHLENYLSGQKLWDIVFTSIQKDPGISEADFQ